MAGVNKFKTSEVLEAIEKGITRKGTAAVLGCSRQTIVNYAKRYSTIHDALEAQKGDLVDLAQMGLRRAVLNGESWAIAFTLKTLGKDEGFTERQEFSGPDGGPVSVIAFETVKPDNAE